MTYGHRPLGALILVLTGTTALFNLGCFFGGGGNSGGGGSSGGDDGDYLGAYTVTNGTGQPICGMDVVQQDHSARHADRIEPGGTATVTLESPLEYIFAANCEGNGFAYAESVNATEDNFTLDSDSAQSYQERFDYLRRLNRMNTNPVMRDEALRQQMFEAVQMRGRDQQWIDDPTAVVIASDDWSVMRHNISGIITRRRVAGMVGHRFPDGHCSIQVHTFQQQHNGSSFGGRIQYEGVAGNIFAGCDMLDWMEAGMGGGSPSAGGASASAGGGSMCTNTCNSANDGECDDGGPGAQYSVCSLGTDCGDCGPRNGGAAAGGGSTGGQCTNTCNSANDGECDDGGPGAQYSVCALGTDCADCGAR